MMRMVIRDASTALATFLFLLLLVMGPLLAVASVMEVGDPVGTFFARLCFLIWLGLFSRLILRCVGRIVLAAWLPRQSEMCRRVVAQLTSVEREKLLWRLGLAGGCGICTTTLPVAVGVVMLSPVALCVAVTLLGSNLLLLDWFRTSQKQWLCRSEYARRENIQPAAL